MVADDMGEFAADQNNVDGVGGVQTEPFTRSPACTPSDKSQLLSLASGVSAAIGAVALHPGRHPLLPRHPRLVVDARPCRVLPADSSTARHSTCQFLASTRDSSARTLTMSASAALATSTFSTFTTDDKLASPAMFGDNDEEDLTLVAFA